ncbi:DNA-processing protein DprA [Verticiella alkaliphila]|uniref:DNA-processing protein DprA n=1 Tax=Verticiella alkaliphila TaxID=2779529 RepID=UPI00209A96E5|nr:DNA-processing protein DprA [Verticiella sp. GG226]
MPDPSTPSPCPPVLRLGLEPGLTPALARALLAECGSAAGVYAASPTRLAAIVGSRLARQLAAPPDSELQAAITAVQAWIAQPDQHCMGWDDPDYPPLLRHIHDPPVLLYVVGQRAALSRPGLAIVGARQGSAGGRETAEAFARHLAVAGWSIVSGLASGIDAAAHAGRTGRGARGAAAPWPFWARGRT